MITILGRVLTAPCNDLRYACTFTFFIERTRAGLARLVAGMQRADRPAPQPRDGNFAATHNTGMPEFHSLISSLYILYNSTLCLLYNLYKFRFNPHSPDLGPTVPSRAHCTRPIWITLDCNVHFIKQSSVF